MLVAPRIAPVAALRATLAAGAWPGLAPQPGEVLWLKLGGAPGGERQLQGLDGRPLRLAGLGPGLPASLTDLPAGTPLAWTVTGTAPHLTLSLRAIEDAPQAAVPAAGSSAKPDAQAERPALALAGEALRPDAQALRLQHPFSGEATRVAWRWRQRALVGADALPDRRAPWRREAAAGQWPWPLLSALAEEPAPPPPAHGASPPRSGLPSAPEDSRWQLDLRQGDHPLGLLLVEPDPDPDDHGSSPFTPDVRPLALRLLLTLPDLGPVVLQLQLLRGHRGLALRLAAPTAESLQALQSRLPEMASALVRLDLALQHCRVDVLGPGMKPWSSAPRLLRADRLPPLLFRAAAELAMLLWRTSPGSGLPVVRR